MDRGTAAAALPVGTSDGAAREGGGGRATRRKSALSSGISQAMALIAATGKEAETEDGGYSYTQRANLVRPEEVGVHLGAVEEE